MNESADELVLCHALEKLRAREGLHPARLQAEARGVAEPLLNLAAVRRHSAVFDLDVAHAAVAVVGECVRDGLNGTDRIVADTVLGLGLFRDSYLGHGVGARIVDGVFSDLLSRRRRALLACWPALHEALAADPGEKPSDRTLRGSLEGLVLRQLSRQLVRRETHSLGASNAPARAAADERTPAALNGHPRGRVVVIGGAVMDATFKTKSIPDRETSNEAHAFDLAPGGKGLTQAVAAARLGLDVALVAAVADDRFGNEIVEHLRREKVDTSMIKLVRDARTPFTGIIEFELGDSVALNWRNEREVRIDSRDVDDALPRLTEADAVLVTFEIPQRSVERAAMRLRERPDRRVILIVTPGQPYADGGVAGQALAEADYLVAHPWELGRYGPPSHETFDLDVVARRLLAYGVGTLCVPLAGGCTIYSETSLGTFTVPTFPSAYKESSASRDAFCAALAAKLIDNRGEFTENVALWATAAMAAAAADHPLPNSMPDRRRVDQLLSRSRFRVAPRIEKTPVSDGSASVLSPG
ncbi:MAG: PfkB family carbohydrate kinase [Actinoplanes sp.]